MTQALPPELQQIANLYGQPPAPAAPSPYAAPAQHYATTPGSGQQPPQQANAQPYPHPAPAPAAPPAPTYQAADGQRYPVPAHLAGNPANWSPNATYAPPPGSPTRPQEAPPQVVGQGQPITAPPGVFADQPNPYAPPAAVAPALAQHHAQQPLPINPPEAQAALSPNAPPPAAPERKRRGKGAAAAKPAEGAAVTNEHRDFMFDLITELQSMLPDGVTVSVSRPLK